MAEEVKFGDIGKKKNYKKFLNISNDKRDITIRFIGHQKKLYIYFDTILRRMLFKEERFFKGKSLSPRIVSFVIDRESDEIKAFACPITSFEQMEEYSSDHDFQIHKEGEGFETKYIVKSLGPSEATKEQEGMVDATLKVYSLEDIFVKRGKWEILEAEAEPIESRFDILDI